MIRLEIAARYLHEARCSGCVDGAYSGKHKQVQIDMNHPKAVALLAELDAAKDEN